ncbi:MAG: hypothetical protein [Microvirus sp.]|nr:MAG: hypothetical protein [Microvirus sp.]
MRRSSMSRSGSRAHFTANAVRHHKANFRAAPMRGGIRL